MIEYIIAFIWGFAEATFFFFIPDIYLTRIALFNPRRAFRCCFITAFSACIGGALMYCWAFFYPLPAYHFLTYVPAIFPKLILQVNHQLLPKPFYSLFIAPLKGIPYKIYAVAFGTQKITFIKFIVTSYFARLFRFLLITGAGVVIVSFLKNHMTEKAIVYVHLIVWAMVYILYFGVEVYFYFS